MNPVILLTQTRPGQMVRIVAIHGGRWSRQKLYQMGLLPGVLIRVETIYHPGPVIVSRGRMRIGVGRGMASRILVEPAV